MHNTEEIRSLILNWQTTGGSMRYPADLRGSVGAYATNRLKSEKVTLTQICRDIGIQYATLRSWVDPSWTKKKPKKEGSLVRPVRVNSAPLGATVVSPSGWQIKGLGIDEIVRLLKAVS